jgi:hypothetical protein
LAQAIESLKHFLLSIEANLSSIALLIYREINCSFPVICGRLNILTLRDPIEKLDAIEKAMPPELRRGVFRAEDKLIAWLNGQKLCGVNPWNDGVK